MLAISQKPERVSNILRSSTPTIRVSGIGRWLGGYGDLVGRALQVDGGWSCCYSFSL